MSSTVGKPTAVPFGSDTEAYADFTDAMDNYYFRRWLEIALSTTEHAKTATLSVSLLKELYPDIWHDGPLGMVWYTQLRQMRRILDSEVPGVTPIQFVAAFINLYTRDLRHLWRTPGAWEMTRSLLKETGNTNALMPDVDSYMQGPPHEVRVTREAARLHRDQPDTYFDFTDALEEHAKTVLASYVLRDMLAAAPLMAAHDAFVEKYGLLNPNA